MKSFRERNPVRLGLVSVLVLGLVATATVFSDHLPIIGVSTTYSAHFAESAGLEDGAEVQIAGVQVGTVRSVELTGTYVTVRFTVSDAWIGNRTSASIKIETLLGEKALLLYPRGSRPLPPDEPIPLERTRSLYDVTEAFQELGETVGSIDTDALAKSFQVLADVLDASTPEDVRAALQGLSQLSETLASRSKQLRKLFQRTNEVSKILAGKTEQVRSLLRHGERLLAELNARKEAISKLLSGTKELATQVKKLIRENQANLAPALRQLERVTNVLRANKAKLSESLRLAGPFYRLLANALGNGPWFDTYLCGLIDVPGRGCMPDPSGGA